MLLVKLFILAENGLNMLFNTNASVLKLPVSIFISNVFPLPLVNRITLDPFNEAVTIANDADKLRLVIDAFVLLVKLFMLLVKLFMLLVKLNMLLVNTFVLPV
jgi:hypothetical protein